MWYIIYQSRVVNYKETQSRCLSCIFVHPFYAWNRRSYNKLYVYLHKYASGKATLPFQFSGIVTRINHQRPEIGTFASFRFIWNLDNVRCSQATDFLQSFSIIFSSDTFLQVFTMRSDQIQLPMSFILLYCHSYKLYIFQSFAVFAHRSHSLA